MSALQRRCWAAARIEGAVVDRTGCRGQRRSRVLRDAEIGGILWGAESLDPMDISFSVTMGLDVLLRK